jgi:outer membrane receptor protein involved in Fe transport
MNRKAYLWRLIASSSIAALSVTTAPADAAEAANDQDSQLQVVVVTAQKRTETLQSVPAAISAIGQDDFQGLGAKTLDDIARTVPGLYMQPYGDAPVIRNIWTYVGVPTVGFYMDDVPISNLPTGFAPSNPAPELYDLERVEVLRGPQGTLYGAGAMGGAIRFITPQAPLEGSSGRSTVELSSGFSGYNPNFNAGGAWGDAVVDGMLGFRGSVYFRETGGYINRLSRTNGDVGNDNVNNVRTAQVHLTFTWKPTSDLTITPGILYQGTHNDDVAQYLSEFPNFNQNNVIGQPGYDNLFLPSLTISYDFGFATLSSTTGYLSRNTDQIYDYSTLSPSIFSTGPIVPGFEDYLAKNDQHTTQQTTTEEIRFASKTGGRFQWTLGGFYSKQRDNANFYIYEPQFTALTVACCGGIPLLPGDLSYVTERVMIEKETALYGEASFELIRGLKILGGLRYSRSELDFTTANNGPYNGSVYTASNGTAVAHPVTPKGGLSYDLTADQLLYATAAKGFRAGGVNQPIPEETCAADLAEVGTGAFAPHPSYDPDWVWSYELGYKSVLLDRKLSVNASIYRINWDDIQQGVSLPNCGFSYTTNYGTARVDGVELEVTAIPLPGLTITARGSYNDGKLTSDVIGPPNNSGSRAVYGLSGDPLTAAPPWSASASAEYHFALRNAVMGYVRGNYQYVGTVPIVNEPGRVSYNPLYTWDYTSPAYSYGSARLGVVVHDWDMALFVNNISNAAPVLSRTNGLNPGYLPWTQVTLQPRVFGLTVQHSF